MGGTIDGVIVDPLAPIGLEQDNNGATATPADRMAVFFRNSLLFMMMFLS
jgi:hypothetical protein